MQKTQTNRKCIVTGKILPTKKLVKELILDKQNHVLLTWKTS